MAKKNATKKVRTMIKGSEGNEDYLVIARQNGYVLGIKPLLMIGTDQAQYGFRLRMQKAQTAEDISKVPEAEAQSMLETFPEVPWGKRSPTRFSTMLMKESSYGWNFREQIMKDALTNTSGMLDDVIEKVAPIKLFDAKDALKFLNDGYKGIVTMIEESMEQNNKSSGKGTADIVAFPNADEDDNDPADI